MLPKDRRKLARHLIAEAIADITKYMIDLRVAGDRWWQLTTWLMVRACIAEANRLWACPESARVIDILDKIIDALAEGRERCAWELVFDLPTSIELPESE